ncbi:MAG: sulfotransferase [Planctomycetes bacterium]|nr:sulfotransferase [Planctomycetota bacterium]
MIGALFRHRLGRLIQGLNTSSVLLGLQKKLHLRPRSLCLVVSCARSGSTAISDWLSKQSGVVYAGQSRIQTVTCRYIQEIDSFKSLTKDRALLLKLVNELVWQYYAKSFFFWNRVLVDKENFDPTTFPHGRYEEFIDTLQYLFPDIKLLFLVRDPVATIWSMHKKKYWGYSLARSSLLTYTRDEYIDIWNQCTILASKSRGMKNVYVCEFEKLVAAPDKESAKIFKFLGIPGSNIFCPNVTDEIGFDQSERQYILDATESVRKALLLETM